MSKRAELRRRARDKEKAVNRIVNPFRNSGIDMVDARMRAGNWFDALDEMYRTDAQRLVDYTGEEMVRELAKAENYMQFGMLMICIQAIKMTFGNLKTVHNGVGKFLNNLTPALEYIDSKGIKESYEELCNLYGFELEFEDYDINQIWEHGDKVDRIVWRIWEKRKPELDAFLEGVGDERERSMDALQARAVGDG